MFASAWKNRRLGFFPLSFPAHGYLWLDTQSSRSHSCRMQSLGLRKVSEGFQHVRCSPIPRYTLQGTNKYPTIGKVIFHLQKYLLEGFFVGFLQGTLSFTCTGWKSLRLDSWLRLIVVLTSKGFHLLGRDPMHWSSRGRSTHAIRRFRLYRKPSYDPTPSDSVKYHHVVMVDHKHRNSIVD